jgi:hypothetical protein
VVETIDCEEEMSIDFIFPIIFSNAVFACS